MISKEQWAKAIKDWEGREIPSAIPRDIAINLGSGLQRVVSIIGPRRTGKTYEMFLLLGELAKRFGKRRTLYVNFERPDLLPANGADLMSLLEAHSDLHPQDRPLWLFLDEVQNVEGWERFVRNCLDEGIKVVVSGSSSKLLSTEIATSLRGRGLSHIIYPFSFAEYLRAKGFSRQASYSSAERSALSNHLADYLEWGGYPEAVIYAQQREKILKDIFDTAILKDVLERHRIRNIAVLRIFIRALLNAKEFSIHRLHNHLKSQGMKIGKNVLYDYLDHLEDAFFVFPLRKFNLSYKKPDQSRPKAYFVDNGLLRVNGIDDKGRLMENLVFIELRRRGLAVSWHQSALKEEVDFVITEGKRVKQLVQVCYSLDDIMTYEREVNALLRTGEEFQCKELIVITMSHEAKKAIKGKAVRFVPLWRWLLEG